MTVHGIAAAVHRGDLERVRRGHYATRDLDVQTTRAVRIGGRLACLAELRHRGVWALDDDRVHVHLAGTASRLRDPDDRTRRLGARESCTLHWRPLVAPAAATDSHVGPIDALAQAAQCVDGVMLMASLDSAVRLGLVRPLELAAIGSLPRRLRYALEYVDAQAESGIESIVREIARLLGFRVRSQVFFEKVGRVDIVVEDWVVVEADGRAFHGAEVTARDRHRDALLVGHGRSVLHFRYAQVVYDRRLVATTIIAAVGTHRNIRNSGSLVRRARLRAEKLGLA